MSSNNYFEQKTFWGNTPEAYQVQVRADILDLLPPDAKSILDVGCGDGFVLSALPNTCRVVGLDTSSEALSHVTRGALIGSITQMPFPDNAFDLVMTNDVIEHLAEEEYQASLREIARVSAKYILVTVPHNEQLQANYAKCATCGKVYHINHHHRAFDLQALSKIFSTEYKPIELRFSGGVTNPPADPTVAIQHALGIYRQWEGAVCPACGSKEQMEPQVDPLTLQTLNAQRSLYWAHRLRSHTDWSNRSEIIGLYARENRRSTKPPPAKSEVLESIHSIDFSNPHQRATPDFTPGSSWAMYTLPQEAEQSGRGIQRTEGAPREVVIQTRLPVKAEIGDRIRVHVSGPGDGGSVRLYSVDGISGIDRQLFAATVVNTNQHFEYVLNDTWWPDRFGLALQIHLTGKTLLHRVHYDPKDPSGTTRPFVLLRPGHNTLRLPNQNPVLSWGLYAEHMGMHPTPSPLKSLEENLSETNRLLTLPEAITLTFSTLTQELKNIRKLVDEKTGVRSGMNEVIRGLQRRIFGLPVHVSEPFFHTPWKPLDTDALRNGHAQRVLVLSHMFPHPDQPASGTFIHEQVQALREHMGLDARVLSGRPFRIGWIKNPISLAKLNRCYEQLHEKAQWWNLNGVPVKYLPYRVFRPFWSHGWTYRASIQRNIEALYESFPFELIHAHTGYLDGSAGLALAKRFNVPLVITEHTGPFSILTKNLIVRRSTIRALNRADRLIAVSQAQGEAVSHHLHSHQAQQIKVIPNGVNVGLFRPSENLIRDPRAPRILFVGYFVPIKNLPLLLEAFSLVLREIPGATLQLVGGGEMQQQQSSLFKRVEALGLDTKVRIRGYQAREAIAQIIREECDILVLCSHSETFGCVLTEAMACGHPVIATSCGGPQDIVNHPTLGELCVPDNATALAETVCNVAKNLGAYSAPAIRKQAVDRFSFEAVSQQLTHEYRAISRNGVSGPALSP